MALSILDVDYEKLYRYKIRLLCEKVCHTILMTKSQALFFTVTLKSYLYQVLSVVAQSGNYSQVLENTISHEDFEDIFWGIGWLSKIQFIFK